MNIYISGIAGTGMGPLALMAKAAGFEVSGSDLSKGAIYNELEKAGIEVNIGEQDGEFLREKLNAGVDWFVYTSALPHDHAELIMAKKAGVKCTKRDDLTAFLVKELDLKMIAVAGTHGKTTTTAMIVWEALGMGLPVSYIVGTTLGFAPSGAYHAGDKYFVYEADEYDRNFLKYHPWLAVIPAVSYDHPDIYPTRGDYEEAFLQFKSQSKYIYENTDDGLKCSGEAIQNLHPDLFSLAGEVRRVDAILATMAVRKMMIDDGDSNVDGYMEMMIDRMNDFPGVGRRFERITEGVYSDYAHHPEEIMATLNIAREECERKKRKGVVVVYQPHQNTRQYEVKDGYREAFVGADKVFWLPTYLTRENPKLPVLRPEDFIKGLLKSDVAEAADVNDDLAKRLKQYVKDGYLVLLMTAGPADGWLRKIFDY